jgi:hypothetical protein
VSLTVYEPDGSTLSNLGTAIPNSWQLPQLPTTGTYTVLVRPTGTASASATLLLSQAVTGTLATDGSSTTYQATRVAQAGRYSFTGTAGQRLTMQATLGPNFARYGVTLTVYQPSGASLATSQFSTSTDVKLDLGALPASGTYTVVLVPSGVNTGSVTLRVVGYASDTLTIGDPARTLTLGTAQNGWYTFEGSPGDLLNLAATSVTTSPTNGYVYVYLYGPDGSSLWSSSVYTPRSTTWQLPQLPVAGTYALAVRPQGTVSANFTLQLPRR